MKKIYLVLTCVIIAVFFSLTAFADSDIKECFSRKGEGKNTVVCIIDKESEMEYHTNDCEIIKYYIDDGMAYEVTIYDAVLYGYTPCKECNAPLLDDYFQEEIINKQRYYEYFNSTLFYELKYSDFDYIFIDWYIIIVSILNLIILPAFIAYLISGARINSRKYNIYGDVYPKGTIWHGFFLNYITKFTSISIVLEFVFVLFEFPPLWELSDENSGDILLAGVLELGFLVLYALYLTNWKKKDFYTNEFAQYNCAKYARLLGCYYFILKMYSNNATLSFESVYVIVYAIAFVLSIIYFKNRMDFFYPHIDSQIISDETGVEGVIPQTITQQQIQQNNSVPITQSNEQTQVQPNIPQKVTVKKIKKE